MRTPRLIAIVAALIGLSCLSSPASVLVGCAKDVDCKGLRICDRGSCVEPAPRTAAAPSRDGGEPAAMQQADAGAQGGPECLPASPPAAPRVTLAGASPEFHADWSHSGRSRFKVPEAAPKHLALIATGGSVVSSPAVTDEGLAIFGSHDRGVRAVLPGDDKSELLTARWTRQTGDMVWCAPALSPISLGNTVSSPVVYVGSDDDHLYALDTRDGSVRWSFLAGPCKRAIGFGPEAARCDVDAVTVGPDGSIVFGCQDARVYAVGPDGGKRWDFRVGDDVDSSPAVAPDGTIYVGSDDKKLYALNPGGTLKWALKTGSDVRSSPAIGEDGTIYVGSFDGNLYAVRPDGAVAWNFSTADRILSSPTIDAAGVVLIGSQDDRLYAVSREGKLVWSVLFDGDVDGTPAIGPGGVIYVGADDKALHILR